MTTPTGNGASETPEQQPAPTYFWEAFGSVWDDDMPETFSNVQWVLTGEVSVNGGDEAVTEVINDLLYELRLNEDGINFRPVEKSSEQPADPSGNAPYQPPDD